MRLKYCTILLLFWITCASLCWGQYAASRTDGVTNVLSYLPSTNAWYLLPGGGVCQPNTLVMFSDVTLYCIGGTYRGAFSYANGVWTRISAMGDNIQQLVGRDSNNIFALLANSYCTSHNFGYGVYKWNGSAWTQPNSLACVQQLAGARDGTLVGAIANVGVWESTDGGVTWPQISGGTYGPNLNYVSAASSSLMCGVNANQVFTRTTGAFTLLAHQPANSDTGISGCAIALSKGNNKTMFVWGPHQVYVQRYDFTAGTWNAVAGGSMNSLTTVGLGVTLAEDSAGHPYHLNVLPPYASGTNSGSWDGCPTQTCANGVTHTIYHDFTASSYLIHEPNQQTVSPTTVVSVPAYTVPLPTSCDYFFGDPAGQTSCQLQEVATAHCDASNTYLGDPVQPDCHIPPLPELVQWQPGWTMHVYFDTRPFCNSGLSTCYINGSSDNNENSVFRGISNWSGAVTNNNNSYVNEGLWNGTYCNIQDYRQAITIPCGTYNGKQVNYPMIFVTSQTVSDDNGGAFTIRSSDGTFSVIAISLGWLNQLNQAAFDQLKSIAAHEEGHDQGLDDCCPLPDLAHCKRLGTGYSNSCTATLGNTVMWGSVNSQSPWIPTTCDIQNVNPVNAISNF